MVNKVLLPYSEKCTVASATDLFLIESLSKFELANFPAIIIEHIHKVMHIKE